MAVFFQYSHASVRNAGRNGSVLTIGVRDPYGVNGHIKVGKEDAFPVARRKRLGTTTCFKYVKVCLGSFLQANGLNLRRIIL